MSTEPIPLFWPEVDTLAKVHAFHDRWGNTDEDEMPPALRLWEELDTILNGDAR